MEEYPSYLSGPAPTFPMMPGGRMGGLTPGYVNVDPSVFRHSEPKYILPQGAAPKRGRFEMAFGQIGLGVVGGFAFGGLRGAWVGFNEHSASTNLSRAMWRTQMLNATMKGASTSGQMVGVIMLLYSGAGVVMQGARGFDDELNSLASGTIAGALYRLSGGVRSSGLGAAIGFGLATAYTLANKESRRRLMQMLRSS